MKLSRAELKAKLLAEAEQAIDQLLAWNDGHQAPTLSELEDAVLKMRKRVSEQAANTLIANQDTAGGSESLLCGHCGQPLRNKGSRVNQSGKFPSRPRPSGGRPIPGARNSNSKPKFSGLLPTPCPAGSRGCQAKSKLSRAWRPAWMGRWCRYAMSQRFDQAWGSVYKPPLN